MRVTVTTASNTPRATSNEPEDAAVAVGGGGGDDDSEDSKAEAAATSGRRQLVNAQTHGNTHYMLCVVRTFLVSVYR